MVSLSIAYLVAATIWLTSQLPKQSMSTATCRSHFKVADPNSFFSGIISLPIVLCKHQMHYDLTEVRLSQLRYLTGYMSQTCTCCRNENSFPANQLRNRIGPTLLVEPCWRNPAGENLLKRLNSTRVDVCILVIGGKEYPGGDVGPCCWML